MTEEARLRARFVRIAHQPPFIPQECSLCFGACGRHGGVSVRLAWGGEPEDHVFAVAYLSCLSTGGRFWLGAHDAYFVWPEGLDGFVEWTAALESYLGEMLETGDTGLAERCAMEALEGRGI